MTLHKSRTTSEIEIPIEELRQPMPEELILSTMRQGYKRYQTKLIQELNEQEYTVSYKMKNFLLEFQKSIFQEFIDYKPVWNETIDIIAELDVLISLSKYSHSGSYQPP